MCGNIDMPKSDDVIEQARSQFIEAESVPNSIVGELVSTAFPTARSAWRFLKSGEQREIQKQFNNCVLDILKERGLQIDDLPTRLTPAIERIAAIAVERIVWGASEKKAKRFAAVLAWEINEPPDEKRPEDAAAYIRALDELAEDDLRVLSHLYRFQADLAAENRPLPDDEFIKDGRLEMLFQKIGSLRMQMEEFYARCGRLSGYGLVLPLERNPGRMQVDQRVFRLTLLGRRLIDMLVMARQNPPFNPLENKR
jgi:hypothetical protein